MAPPPSIPAAPSLAAIGTTMNRDIDTLLPRRSLSRLTRAAAATWPPPAPAAIGVDTVPNPCVRGWENASAPLTAPVPVPSIPSSKEAGGEEEGEVCVPSAMSPRDHSRIARWLRVLGMVRAAVAGAMGRPPFDLWVGARAELEAWRGMLRDCGAAMGAGERRCG